MSRLLTRLAHGPIVASSTRGHLGSSYIHWVLESSPGPGTAVYSYERNLRVPAGNYLVTVQATGSSTSLNYLSLYPGDGTNLKQEFPTGATTWMSPLKITGQSPSMRINATGFDHLLLVMHRI